eukprot:m.170037 g.170037  ORF g.170037 m.170037 type:complete len:791 (+) comp15335_c0_seq1:129-2501(+)
MAAKRRAPAQKGKKEESSPQAERRGETSYVVPALVAVCICLLGLLLAGTLEESIDNVKETKVKDPAEPTSPATSESEPVVQNEHNKTRKPASENGAKKKGKKSKKDTNCDKLQAQASSALRNGKYQDAVDALMQCTDLQPNNASSYWNVGVLLSRLRDYDNALSWMQQAIKKNDTNTNYYKGASTTAARADMPDVAASLLSVVIEDTLRLDRGSWNNTLLISALSSPEDLVWITDEAPLAVELLKIQAKHYLDSRQRVFADAIMTVVLKLDSKDHDVARTHADFLFGMGRVADAAQVQLTDMMAQISEAAEDVDAFGVAHNNALLHLTSGFDAHYINIARNLLRKDVLQTDKELIASFEKNCGVRLEENMISPSISASRLRNLFGTCLEKQGLIPSLAKGGGSSDLANGFGFRPLHHSALLGHGPTMAAIIELKPLMDVMTNLNHTALHLAIMRGNIDVLTVLLLSGVPKDYRDRMGRSPLDVACYHPWIVSNVTTLFGTSPDRACRSIWGSKTPPEKTTWTSHPSVGGGWLSPNETNQNQQRSCDFEVIEGDLTDKEFYLQYLAIQRPVLVRKGMTGARWTHVQKKFSRENFLRTFWEEEVHRGEIPYSKSFGLESNITTIQQHLAYTRWVLEANEKGKGPKHPAQVFESLDGDSPISQAVMFPSFVDTQESKIQMQNIQFYLGPPGSGAPLHFHRAALNVLAYGRKEWILQPPAYAEYSREHPKSLFEGSTGRSQHTYRCIQESGDILFVPEVVMPYSEYYLHFHAQAWGHATMNLAESIGWASEFLF